MFTCISALVFCHTSLNKPASLSVPSPYLPPCITDTRYFSIITCLISVSSPSLLPFYTVRPPLRFLAMRKPSPAAPPKIFHLSLHHLPPASLPLSSPLIPHSASITVTNKTGLNADPCGNPSPEFCVPLHISHRTESGSRIVGTGKRIGVHVPSCQFISPVKDQQLSVSPYLHGACQSWS